MAMMNATTLGGLVGKGQKSLVDGKVIHYYDAGARDAEPLMLIHGGGPGASGLSNYSRNIDALGAKYRLIIPDMPGYGDSNKDAITGPRYAAYSKSMLGLLDNLQIAKAHIVGNSLGGGAALLMALDAPERVGRLVLMGPAGLMTAHSAMPTEGARMIIGYYGGSGPSKDKLHEFLKLMIYDASNLTEELLEERYQASIAADILENPPLGRGQLPILEEIWRDPRLAKMPHETLVLWGRDDRVNLLATSQILLNQLRNARFVTFTQCGHWVQWERAQAFNTLVPSFLAGGL
jgi:4,5:9,10-diseco-3-hydroxy-5,9,17-trioxoandrosta-1(10),2-diene-4-oate hydrolase